ERVTRAHARGVFAKERGGTTRAAIESATKVFRVERELVEARHVRDAVEVARHGIERDVVEVVAPPCGVRQTPTQRPHQVLTHDARHAPEARVPRVVRKNLMRPLSRRLPHAAWGRNY